MKKGWVGIGANKAYIKQIIVYLAKWNEDIVMNIYIYTRALRINHTFTYSSF